MSVNTTDTSTTPNISDTIDDSSQVNAVAKAAQAAQAAEAKKTSFDHEVRALIKQAQDTVISKYPDEAVRELKPPMELVSLNRYNTIYTNMSPTEHYKYFETIFNRKRMEIITCLKGDASKGERHIDDRWLRTGNIVVQFGEGTKAPSREIEEKRKLVRIMLSDIYLIACDLQRQAEEVLSEIGADTGDKDISRDLIRSSILMLHLMRIFYHLNEGNDKKQLGEIVTFLEIELGVSKRTISMSSVDVATKAATAGAATGGLSSLFHLATNMMKQFGVEPPKDMIPPSEEEITKVISNVFSNEATQGVLQSVITGLNGTQDFGTAIQKAVAGVTDPKTMEAIRSSVMSTAEQAANRPGQATQASTASPQTFEAVYKE